MKRVSLLLCIFLVFPGIVKAQNQDIRVVADTLVVQAEGTFEADPDLATLTFDISSQEKEMKLAYDKASEAMLKIAALAAKNGLRKEDVLSGVLVVTPFYEGDRKKRTKSFLVQGQVQLKIHDFSKIGAIMDESVEDEITDFRSLTYSLSDEEAAKQRAVAEAMRRAVGRATAALDQKGQKVGALRFANLDVKQIARISSINMEEFDPDKNADGAVQVSYVSKRGASPKTPPPPPVPMPQPKKIIVSASVQCGFQIQ